MTRLFSAAISAIAAFAAACATPTVADAQPPAGASAVSSWENVARVVAIGDLHGDYPKFVDMATQAGLIDANGDWIGGQTHFVQLGDVPDRGADTRKILDHLMRIEPQAAIAGGRVHALIGNHEAMNIEGDLRYVSAGEYAAFVDADSPARRDAYYAEVVRKLRETPPPEGLPVFDEAHRARWNAEHPLGFVEHREAWRTNGLYGGWIADHDAVIRINDTLYMHAGLGPLYRRTPREAINLAVRSALDGLPDPRLPDITHAEEGPLWYRGLALNAEVTEASHLRALLATHKVARIVVGHTKRASMVLPRFEGRVIVTDVAVPARYPDPRAFLIAERGALSVMHRGQRVPLDLSTRGSRCAYFAQIAALDPEGAPTRRLVETCGAPNGATAIPSGSAR